MSIKPFFAVLLMAACSGAMAQAVTYDFTGTVEYAEGAWHTDLWESGDWHVHH